MAAAIHPLLVVFRQRLAVVRLSRLQPAPAPSATHALIPPLERTSCVQPCAHRLPAARISPADEAAPAHGTTHTECDPDRGPVYPLDRESTTLRLARPTDAAAVPLPPLVGPAQEMVLC